MIEKNAKHQNKIKMKDERIRNERECKRMNQKEKKFRFQ